MRTGVSWSLTNSPQFAGVSAVQIPGVRSLPPAEVAIASILAPGLWARQTRSWRRPRVAHEDRQDQIDKPSIAYWRDHSAGASRRRVTPMPRGNRPSTAAFTSSGARKASEIVILTCRMLHFSRAAICSTLVTVPAMISSSQRRPRAMEATSVTRVSARIGRRSSEDTEAGTMISRRRFIGVFFHGTRKTSRSLSTALGGSLDASALSSTAN